MTKCGLLACEIIAKIHAEKLKPSLDKIVSTYQAASIKGLNKLFKGEGHVHIG